MKSKTRASRIRNSKLDKNAGVMYVPPSVPSPRLVSLSLFVDASAPGVPLFPSPDAFPGVEVEVELALALGVDVGLESLASGCASSLYRSQSVYKEMIS